MMFLKDEFMDHTFPFVDFDQSFIVEFTMPFFLILRTLGVASNKAILNLAGIIIECVVILINIFSVLISGISLILPEVFHRQ